VTALHLCLHSRASVARARDGLVVGKAGGAAVTVRASSPAPAAVLAALATPPGGTLEALLAVADAADPACDPTRIHYLLLRLEQRGLLALSLHDGAQALVTLEPMTPHWQRLAVDPLASYRLSRFAWLHRRGNRLTLESAIGHCRLAVDDPRIGSVVAALATPQTAQSLRPCLPLAHAETLPILLMLLASARAIFPCDAAGQLAEDTDPALRGWDSHDLHFHARSRLGRHDDPHGATFHLANTLPQPPAIKPVVDEPRLLLPRPNPPTAGRDFFAVLEARRSIRMPADTPLDLVQLATLLWYVARVQTHWTAHPDEPRRYEATARPVPAGGAIHELEFYLTISRCTGVDPGLYRYDPLAHALIRVRAADATTNRLATDAMQAAGLSRPADVLITLAARFGRLNWKYQGLAYAAILKHVGVVYQQLYLVATALELAPCALGSGNAEHFAAAAGTDTHAEGSVGEFLISARAPTHPQATVLDDNAH